MNHDPMCTYAAIYDGATPCPECDLIARVRSDEREQAAERVAGYLKSSTGTRAGTIMRAVAAARGGE